MADNAESPKTRRRRSLGFLRALNTATENDGQPSEPSEKRRPRPLSSLLSRSPKDDLSPGGPESGSSSPRLRPRTLLKASRPSSIFGSLRSNHSADEREKLTGSSAVSSFDPGTPTNSTKVLLHGEVHVSGGMFGKRKEYLVLTDTLLVRFKNRSRATEVYPSIPGSLSRNTSARNISTASSASLHEVQTSTSVSSVESKQGIQLNQIIAVSRLDDGRPIFSIEIAHLEDEISHASSMILQINDPKDADLWLSSIRAASTKARLTDRSPYTQMTLDHVVSRLDLERDYDPNLFQLYKVVQRVSGRSLSRQSDDPSKSTSAIKYLAIGTHKVHIISVQDTLRRVVTNSSSGESAQQTWYGIMTLASISVRAIDDVFELKFRMPLAPPVVLSLASVASAEIFFYLRQMMEYLRPNWVYQPCNISAPKHLKDEPPPLPSEPGEYDHFDRTLVAYSAAYSLDTSAIRYSVQSDVEDAPLITLLPPGDATRLDYALLELLAFFRALRFNQAFHSVSFAGINLEVLHECRDFRGTEHVPFLTRSGQPLSIINHEALSLLVQEIQGLAISNTRLRRMDFSYSITRRPNDDVDDLVVSNDPGCEICQAIFPLCRRGLTNVDWITLNGIELGESDLDYLVDAAVERACHFRALEIGSCNLTDRSLQLILNAMLSQDATLESIDLSSNLARLSPATFQSQIGHFGLIRRLNLSRVQRTLGPEPLVAPETLLTWRLEELHLSQTQLNEQTVDSLSAYLACDMSSTLRELHLDQCGLTGRDLAVFMHSMTRTPGVARDLHLSVSENRLEKDHDKFVNAVRQNMTPTQLTMKMVEYLKEDHFRDLITAMQENSTLKYLDISKASLPYDANEDTCEALQQMFAQNTSLEVLDISGEFAHLETAKFGIGLNHALMGLVNNKTLRVLRIEYQKLGLQGASTLSTVLDTNTTLEEIYCEHNDINLQGLTVLVNALQKNRTVKFLPPMHEDRHRALGTIWKEVEDTRQDLRTIPSNKATQTIRRGFAAVRNNAAPKLPSFDRGVRIKPTTANQDQQEETFRILNDKWDKQVQRLERYLVRNYNLANGLMTGPEIVLSGFTTDDEDDGTDTQRPPTATGLVEVKDKGKKATTPREEKSEYVFFNGGALEKLSLGKASEGRDKENNFR